MSDSYTVPNGFVEATAPELFKFEKKGDLLEGILLAVKQEIIKGDRVLEMYVNTGRTVKKYRPGYDVKSKLKKDMIGKHVIIRYYGDDESKGKDGNAMKVFGLYYKPIADHDGDDPGITDEDIPF
jgi:hemerythrin superfamily protein